MPKHAGDALRLDRFIKQHEGARIEVVTNGNQAGFVAIHNDGHACFQTFDAIDAGLPCDTEVDHA